MKFKNLILSACVVAANAGVGIPPAQGGRTPVIVFLYQLVKIWVPA